MTRIICLSFFLLIFFYANSQNYSTSAEIGQRIKALELSYPALLKVTSLTKTAGGKDIWALEIGSGDRANHPGIAVIGGVEGSHLLGQELALGFAERILKDSQKDSVKNVLATTAFYVFPALSPDASEQYFAAIKYERTANANPTDDDRDGRLNEDPFEDLNHDGFITMVRVEAPEGKWKKHSADERVMVVANLEKGERGNYIVFTEGIDNDKDNKWNEDPEGGVNVNKNMSFDPPYFTPGAGETPASEPENRALMDYLFARFNVFAVVTFGPSNNLSDPWKFDKSKTSQRVISGILENDASINKMASELYKKITKSKDAPAAPSTKGDVSQWAYFHYGRQSFSTPGWWIPKSEAPKDSAAAKKTKPDEDKNTDVDFLKWAEKEGVEAFIPWQKINHPDYPGKTVEVGGIRPFVKINPPYKGVAKLVEDHTRFLIGLAERKPEVELINVKTEPLGNGVTRVSATLRNKGLFPANAEIGQNSYWTKQVKVTLSTAKEKVISGNKITLFPNLGAGETKDLTWLISGKDKLTIEAGAPQTGIKKIEIDL